MKYDFRNERRVLDLTGIGLPEIPVLGRYRYSSAHPCQATHVHRNAVEICYLERGCQIYRVAGQDYRLIGGELFVTAPGEPHDTGGHPEDRGVLYWLNLRLPDPGGAVLMLPPEESVLLANKLCHLPQRKFPGRPALKEIFRSIFDQYDRREGALWRVALANQLVRCVLEVIQAAHHHDESSYSPRIALIAERIESSPEIDYSLAELAQEAGLSTSRFKANFKVQFGVGPHEFILRCKMEAAKKLLTRERLTVTKAAMRLGFSSSQYFATVFKRYTQQTPLEFSARGPAISAGASLSNSGRATESIQN